jgi:hypothetical protein
MTRHILLDRSETHPALAEAIGATGLPAVVPDATPVPGPAVAALPGDHTANIEGMLFRWKDGFVGCKFNGHGRLSHGLMVRSKQCVCVRKGQKVIEMERYRAISVTASLGSEVVETGQGLSH